MSPHGHIHLIDFGIARVLTPNTQTITYLRGSGSVDYCALEQTAGGTDQRCDIYSLGATLFHLLTLKTPPRATELASKNKSVPSPRLWNSGIPAPLEDLIVKMMAVRREDRCNSMTYVHGVLLQVKELIEKRMALPRGTALSCSKKKTGPVPESRPWVAVATLTSIVLALLIWLIWNLAPKTASQWSNH